MGPAITAGIAGAGVLANAHGSYLQSQQADKQYQMAVRAWEEERRRQRKMDEQGLAQQALGNSMAAGQYAQNQANDIQDPYVQYARRLGL
jgi:hypothetical protein